MPPRAGHPMMMCDTQDLARLRAAASSMDGNKLTRAAARHADTQSKADILSGEGEVFRRPASGRGARVVGERKTAGPSTRHSDETDLPWEPMG